MKKLIQIVFITLILLLFFSCGGKYDGQSEGEIHFKVSYPKMNKNNFMLDFMPKKMLVQFKDDKISTSLSAGMGMFKFGIISNVENQELIRIAKLINKKYSLHLNNETVFTSLKKQPAYKIEFTDETKTILGYQCKKINVIIEDGLNEPFAAYYTDKINIENPNWFNQYAPVKGVLLEYQYERYDMRMKVTATKIHFKELKENAFDLPEQYVEVPEEKMEKEMTELFSSFQ